MIEWKINTILNLIQQSIHNKTFFFALVSQRIRPLIISALFVFFREFVITILWFGLHDIYCRQWRVPIIINRNFYRSATNIFTILIEVRLNAYIVPYISLPQISTPRKSQFVWSYTSKSNYNFTIGA